MCLGSDQSDLLDNITGTPSVTTAAAPSTSSGGFFDSIGSALAGVLPSALTVGTGFASLALQNSAATDQEKLQAQLTANQQAAAQATFSELLPWLLIGGGVLIVVMLFKGRSA